MTKSEKVCGLVDYSSEKVYIPDFVTQKTYIL